MSEIFYVEVRQKLSSTLPQNDVKAMLKQLLMTQPDIVLNTEMITLMTCVDASQLQQLLEHVDSVVISSNNDESRRVRVEDWEKLKFLVYRLSQELPATETMEHDSEELSVACHTVLPTREFDGLWESLYYDENIKGNLLNFVQTTMLFSDRKVDHNIISWNKVILLHGPPGTGKTSLCRAIAQKAAIRLGDRYAFAQLVEINSHSLFSKWFSESGKLVMKLFDEIRRLLDNPDAFICVLIDEVESLAHARKSCANGTEPSDAIRVVNALLTQLDQIKRYPNVLILTTSNVTEAIDLAFVDRADIKQYIGHPGYRAIHKIYSSCLEELMRIKLVRYQEIKPLLQGPVKIDQLDESEIFLLNLCQSSVGLSGRSLRKIPFLAHAIHVQDDDCSLKTFLKAMETTIKTHKDNKFL